MAEFTDAAYGSPALWTESVSGAQIRKHKVEASNRRGNQQDITWPPATPGRANQCAHLGDSYRASVGPEVGQHLTGSTGRRLMVKLCYLWQSRPTRTDHG